MMCVYVCRCGGSGGAAEAAADLVAAGARRRRLLRRQVGLPCKCYYVYTSLYSEFVAPLLFSTKLTIVTKQW